MAVCDDVRYISWRRSTITDCPIPWRVLLLCDAALI